MPELGARAAVLTGEAAVNLGAAGQGMVAGDLVNAASRVQGAAEPHAVLVGDPTRRATEAAIAYADAGLHELKGKTEAMQLWRAAPRDRRSGRRTEVARPRAAVRRPRPRAAAREGALPRPRRRAQGASALDHRHRRHRQVAARLGALQVPRRHLSGRGLAPRPLPGLRRRRDVLGARRDDPDARGHRRGRGRRDGVVEARRRSRERRRRRRGTRVDPAARRPAPVARGALGPRAGRAVRRVASLLRTARGARPGRARLRGHAMGRCTAARVRRVSARVVAQSRDPRRCARPARVGRGQGAVGGRAQERDDALSRAPVD